MNGIIYYTALPFIYLVSLLPFRILYLISDTMYFFVYYIFRYRIAVTRTNLKNAFPEKTDKEVIEISKKYYRYICDLVLETFKTLTIDQKKALRHCSYKNLELLERLYRENKHTIIVMGHYGNWEWAGSRMPLLTEYKVNVIYKPLKNKYFDQLIYKIRSRFGTGLIPHNNVLREMLKKQKHLTMTAFIADQTPAPENAYWIQFLNQDTPVFTGTEKIARKLNFPVLYANVKRVKRGYYQVSFELLVSEPQKTKEGEITELHTKRLEKDIRELPEIWLWSHRRWKHKRKKG